MTKIEMIVAVLTEHSCLTSKEIANFIWRKYEERLTPQSVAGAIRDLYNKGRASKGTNLKGNTVYWLNDNRIKVKV